MVVNTKKQNACHKVCHKEKTNFENYKDCLVATELKNEIKYLEQNKINRDSLEINHKEFIKNNKLTLQHSKDLKVKDIMFLLKKLLIRLLYISMMIKNTINSFKRNICIWNEQGSIN